MSEPIDHSRRGVLLAGTALAALPVASLAATPAASGKVVADEFWADKKGVRLWVYRKRLEGTQPTKRLFCVHGSSYSGKTMFDLQVPERTDYSMMDHFARRGYEVWTMDHEGYGRSQRTTGNSDIQSGVQDLKAAMGAIEKAGGVSKLGFFGQSSGALRAARFANRFPDHVEKLALDAFTWTGKGAPTLIQRAKNIDRYTSSNKRTVSREFYESIFTRDHSGAAEAMLGKVIADEELRYGDSVPTGTYVDMVLNLPVVDPEKLKCPVMIIRAEHDGIATDEDIINFYSKIASADKQLVKISGLAHTAMLGINRGRFFHALDAFLSLPPLVALEGTRQH